MSGPAPQRVPWETVPEARARAARSSESSGLATFALPPGSASAAGNQATAQLAGRPRSLDESFSPDALSDEELILEQLRLQQWLEARPASSTDRVRAEGILLAVRVQLGKRSAKEFVRPGAPLLAAVAGPSTAMALASAGFAAGFLQGASLYAADHPAQVPIVTRLQEQLGKPLNSGAFNLGVICGLPKCWASR